MNQKRETTFTRRRLLEVGTALGMAGFAVKLLPRTGLAQTNPDNPDGYPELTATIDDKGLTVPDQVPGGLAFVTVTSAATTPDMVIVWGRLADGVSKDEVAAAVGKPPEGQDDPTTQLLKDQKLVLLGGPAAPAPGKSSSGIILLQEGTHVVFNAFGQQSAFFEVTPAGADAKTEEPKADLTVQLGNMVYVGLDEGVPAGKHLWRIENIDTMVHELIIVPAEPGMTEDDFKQMLEQFAGEDPAATPGAIAATPPPAASGDAGDQSGGGTSLMSAETTSWALVDLPAGHYAAVCMIPMDWEGPPHAFMGMIKMFDVA